MTARDATIVFICLTPVVWAAWSAFMWFALRNNDATISKVLLDWSREYRGFLPLLAFVAGIVAGHWFWSQEPPK